MGTSRLSTCRVHNLLHFLMCFLPRVLPIRHVSQGSSLAYLLRFIRSTRHLLLLVDFCCLSSNDIVHSNSSLLHPNILFSLISQIGSNSFLVITKWLKDPTIWSFKIKSILIFKLKKPLIKLTSIFYSEIFSSPLIYRVFFILWQSMDPLIIKEWIRRWW